jgi:hypothetical protein
MKLNLIPVLVAGLLAAAPAFSATPVTIDFEAPASFASIADFYSAQGVSFGLDALAFQQDMITFSNAPSPIGVMAAVGPDATMNVASGFTGAVSFFYSAPADTTLHVWSDLNGLGTQMGVFSLSANSSAYDSWTQVSLNLGNGVAKSITFGEGAATLAAFDNVTIAAVPEPSEALMLALGLGVVSQVVRRARRKQASA